MKKEKGAKKVGGASLYTSLSHVSPKPNIFAEITSAVAWTTNRVAGHAQQFCRSPRHAPYVFFSHVIPQLEGTPRPR
jgi:hypothetical protein